MVHGRVERLVHDALVVPTDAWFTVEPHWYEALGSATHAEVRSLRPELWGSGRLAGQSADGRAVWFVDVARGSTASLGDAVREVLAGVAQADLVPSVGRQRPLVAMPLVGIGRGDHQPGEVIEAVLDAAEAAVVAPGSPDVALVVLDENAYAAAQHLRRSRGSWPLPDDLLRTARVLGERARSGDLAVFAGAGVSIPAGSPRWAELLDDAERRLDDGLPDGADDLAPLDRAELLRRRDDDLLRRVIKERCDPPKHALGHAMLVAMRCRENVTTNFDRCLEMAADHRLVVLPGGRPTGRKPWLLKMHGTIEVPETIVLTRGDFARYDHRYRAAASVLQSLVLTRHVLFVGVSMTDDNVLRLTYEVALSRRRPRSPQHWGTVVALGAANAKAALYADELDWVAIEGEGADDTECAADAARTIEMFMDVVAAHAQEDVPWLLNERFAGMLQNEQAALVAARLVELGHEVASLARADPGTWRPVLRSLESAGWNPSLPRRSFGVDADQP